MLQHLHPPRLALVLAGLLPLATFATGIGLLQPTQTRAATRITVLTHRTVVHINISNLAFTPAAIVISPGTHVIWTNKDDFQHTVTSDKGAWDSGPVNFQGRYARVFKTTGVFTYHCTIHPFMHGTITVKR